MSHSGLFQLRTAKDLLAKAEHDLDRLQAKPLDVYAAFDLLVTARHVPDWLHPNDLTQRNGLFAKHVELRICRHVADGAKHFVATAKHHQQVSGTNITRDAWGGAWDSAWGGSWGKDALVVQLDPADPDTSVTVAKYRLWISAKELSRCYGRWSSSVSPNPKFERTRR